MVSNRPEGVFSEIGRAKEEDTGGEWVVQAASVSRPRQKTLKLILPPTHNGVHQDARAHQKRGRR